MPRNRWLSAAAGPLLCACVCAVSAAETGRFHIEQWKTDDGLPENSVITLTQTHNGYLWLGTLRGLARFDGVHFKAYNDGNTPGLTSSKILHLYQDWHTNLWIGTESPGVSLVKPDGTLQSLSFRTQGFESILAGVTEEPAGDVWFRTIGGQAYRYRDGKLNWLLDGCSNLVVDTSGLIWLGTSNTTARSDVLIGLRSTTPSASAAFAAAVQYETPVGKLDFLLASKSGGVWVFANERIVKRVNDKIERDLGFYPWLPHNAAIRDALEDASGNLILGTLGEGIYWYSGTNQPEHIYSSVRGLSHDSVLSLCLDQEGALWVGTDGGGLNRVKRQLFRVKEEGKTQYSVSKAADDTLWLASAGKLVSWKDQTRNEYATAEGLPVDRGVQAVLVASDQRTWIRTGPAEIYEFKDRKFRLSPGSDIVDGAISCLFQDRKGRLWATTARGLATWDGRQWKTFAPPGGMSVRGIQAVTDDREGNFWLATESDGLLRLKDGRLQKFGRDEGLPSNNVMALFVDSEDVLWVGTSGGLARRVGDKFIWFKTQDLAKNGISYLLEDGQGFLWLGSTAGLVRVEKKTLNEIASGKPGAFDVRHYGEADGLPSSECTFGSEPAACRTRDGNLWFPTIKGVATINPGILHRNTN
ncbi:MAG TPA: two-component regulator propeller domain-containing protein, partial [Candidatus Dormibacteraeota bacterium]|nr:two-component regulator propeller domain-containing protein [Candidatus Dormibacteraeota bacterium]